MEWLLWVIAGIFLIGLLWGIYRGAVRIAVSLVTTIVTFVIVLFVTPYVSDLVVKYLPFDEMIESSISETLSGAITSSMEESAGDASEGLTESEIQAAMDAAGVSEDEIDLTEDQQAQAIAMADLPEVFKNLLSRNNNSETYSKLGVETFSQYAGAFLADAIINALTFLVLFLLVTILMRAVIFALDIVTDLPVLGAVNRIAGGAVGLLCALIIVWFIFIIITLLYTTSLGREMYDVIIANSITKFIYDMNPIMGLIVR